MMLAPSLYQHVAKYCTDVLLNRWDLPCEQFLLLMMTHTNKIVRFLAEHGGYRVLQAPTIAAVLPPLCAVLAVFRKEYGLAPRLHPAFASGED